MKEYNFLSNGREKFVAVDRCLAADLGIDEAIVVSIMATYGDGFHRIPFKEWQRLMPFYSISKINRLVRGLEDAGVLESTTKFNESGLDKTKSYKLRIEAIEAYAQTK